MRMRITLRYNGETYTFDEGHWTPDDLDLANYLWTEGNFACDCNRSQMIRQHVDGDFPDLSCGETIELVDLTVPVLVSGG